MYDYKLLEALAMVVQEGGFERAARALHITQSAISQRVKLLEEELGQILVIRASPPSATPAGVALIRHYRQVALLERGLEGELALEQASRRSSLRLAVNADSLSTWFIEAITPFMQRENVLLDLRVDDEERTHRLLRDGEVIGCVSSRPGAMQGCRVESLGRMRYRLLATPDFAARRFPDGVTLEAVAAAPLLVFNRKDALHNRLLVAAVGSIPAAAPLHYVPSPEQCCAVICAGLACGMLSDVQSRTLLESGALVDLVPSLFVDVHLYWHCWNLDSPLLKRLTQALTSNAGRLLAPTGPSVSAS